jgi:Uma2 family endonuclease
VTAARPLFPPTDLDAIDQFVRINGVTWKDYEAILAMRGERGVPRVTYVEGVLELMSPSRFHETDKKRFARLLETWSEEMGVKLEGVGSWTLKKQEADRGAEPDECYTINRVPESDEDRPDVAIEVIWTSGGINKLEVYRKLGVREVWFYERGTLRFFTLQEEQYTEISRSELLPAVDPELLVRHMAAPSQSEAVAALRAELRTAGKR